MGFNPFGCCASEGGSSGGGVSLEQLNELLKLKVNYTDTLLIKAVTSAEYEALSDEEKNSMVYLISDLDETDDNNLSNLLQRIIALENQINNIPNLPDMTDITSKLEELENKITTNETNISEILERVIILENSIGEKIEAMTKDDVDECFEKYFG